MWFIGVEVEQETSAPPPKKILDPPLSVLLRLRRDFVTKKLDRKKGLIYMLLYEDFEKFDV